MKRIFLVTVLASMSMFCIADNSADRTKCCHGCNSYGCNKTNCGDKCSEGPNCHGCWKSCVR
jgi:hypothetical protein